MNAIIQKRPASLTIISALCLLGVLLTIAFFLWHYNRNPYASGQQAQWYLVMIAIHIPIILGVVLMYRLKRIGLWLFLVGKILLFALPAIAGIDVMGLLTPVFFIESATFFILFAKRIQYMS